jgi:hypothetical protein
MRCGFSGLLISPTTYWISFSPSFLTSELFYLTGTCVGCVKARSSSKHARQLTALQHGQLAVRIGKAGGTLVPWLGKGSVGAFAENGSGCLLLDSCVVLRLLSRCRLCLVLLGVGPLRPAQLGVLGPKPRWGRAWSPIWFVLGWIAFNFEEFSYM